MPATDQGADQDRYKVIPRTLIFITCGERVLLLKGAPTKRLWANRYNGVGGHIERGEDVLSAGRRELLEETGLTVDDLRLRGVVMVDVGAPLSSQSGPGSGAGTGIALYVLTGTTCEERIIPSDEGGLEWVNASHIQELALVSDLYELLPRVLAMRPDEAPFSARYYYRDDGELQIVFGA